MTTAIASFLKKRLGAKLQSRIEEMAKSSSGGLISALDIVIKETLTPKSAQIQLQIVKLLCSLTSNDLSVTGWILAGVPDDAVLIDGCSEPLSVAEHVAATVFPSERLDSLLETEQVSRGAEPKPTKTDLENVQARFFRMEPMASMVALLRAKRFTVPQDVADVGAITVSVMSHYSLEMGSLKLASVVQKECILAKLHFDMFKDAQDIVKTIQILTHLVQNAEYVPLLYNNAFRSVRQISIMNKVEFGNRMVGAGMKREDALRIHDYAERIDCRNEHQWFSLMQHRRTDFIPVVPRQVGDRGTHDKGDKASQRNLTDMFRLEDTACETCCSATSLTAYFADLMALLRDTSVHPSNQGGESDSTDERSRQTKPQSLLELLSLRRPDLREMELSCSNAQTLIPFIDLINEVLESYIRYKADPALSTTPKDSSSINVHNSPIDDNEIGDGHQGEVYRPGNIDNEIYTEIIAGRMFPFTHFPYSLPKDIITQFFATFRVQIPDLLAAYNSPDTFLAQLLQISAASGVEPSTAVDSCDPKLLHGASEVLRRHFAAESLGLQQSEFASITGETFFPSWFADILQLSENGTSVETGCRWSAANLWGYDTVEAMTDTVTGDGLSFIKEQLMARSGIEFQDVLDLVSSQYFCQDLVITNSAGSNQFKNSIQNLRLLSNASKPPFQPLTEELCFRLQSFIRLLSKSKLSVKELDAAVFCLRTREIQTLDGSLNNRDLFSISPFVVTSIAAAVELAKLSGLEILSLLPIWGVMDSFGLNSFFRRRFLTRNLAQIDPIFASPIISQSGLNHIEYLTVNGEVTSIKDHELGICAGFHWPLEHFQSLLTATGLQDAKLTLDTFSSLYRHALLCQILEVSPKDCIKLYSIIRQSEEQDVFQDPTTTYAIVKRWKSLFERGWTVESLATTLQISDEHGITETSNAALETTLAIQNGAKDLQKSLAFLFTRNIANDKAIVDCVSHLFEAEAAKIVIGFVQGTQVNTETVTVSQEEYQTLLKSSAVWPPQLSMIPQFGRNSIQLQLVLTGVLSCEDTTTLRSSTSGPVKQKLTIIIKQSLMPLKIIRPRFAKCQESRTKLDSSVFDQEWQTWLQLLGEGSSEQPEDQHYATDDSLQSSSESELSSSESTVSVRDPVVQREIESRARREAFVNISSPTIIEERLTNLVINSVQDHIISDLEPSLLNLLLTEVLQIKRGDITQSAITILQQLGDVGAAPGIDANSLDVFFVPNRADIFTFHFDQSTQELSSEKETDTDKVPTPEKTSQLRINGIPLPYNKVNATWAAIRLTAGQPYRLQARFSASNLQWSTSRSLPARFSSDDLISAAKVERAAEISALLTRAGGVCTKYQLTTEEVVYLNKGSKNSTTILGVNNAGFEEVNRLIQVDLNAPTFEDLVSLQRYFNLRDHVRASRLARGNKSTGTSGAGLIDLFLRLSDMKSTDALQIGSIVSEHTGWNKPRLVSAIESLHRGRNCHSLAKAYGKFESLCTLQSIMEFDQGLIRTMGGTSPPEISMLFDIARPRHSLGSSAVSQDMSISQSLQSRLADGQRTAMDEKLRENQRKVLVTYLLQQPYITEELGLFDADGLFEHFLIDVQMGPQLRTSRIKQAISVVQLFVQRCLLGLEKGIPKGILPREKWDWMQQYVLWEAHRKMFLYPESWIEPSLRDDKSQIFDQFESSLMQKDLSIDTFLHAMQTYIYSLKEISNLEIVAYLYETQAQSRQVVHFFGRTRASPHTFYYRSVTTRLPDADEIFWSPWSKIDMHIPCTETDWEGQRLEESGVYLLPVLIGRRLYLFMPQIIPKPHVDSTSPSQSGKFESLSDKTISDSGAKKAWEVTMAWTEYTRNGWTPKRVSPGSLFITNNPPKVAEFCFDPIVDEGTKLTILVSYKETDIGTVSTAGAFAFFDDQIAVTKTPTQSPWKRPFDNVFQQVPKLEKDSTSTSLDSALETYKAAQNKAAPLIWIPDALQEDQGSLRWTLSSAYANQDIEEEEEREKEKEKEKEKSRWIGLVVSKSNPSGSRVNYFNLPQNRLLGGKWDDTNLSSNMSLITLDHTFSGQLVQAAADRLNPLRQVYHVLAAQDPFSEKETFGRGSYVWFHELGQPSSLYTWEIGMHAVFLAVDRFFATQQFEEALQLARLVFDPTIDIEGPTSKGPEGSSSQSCWRFPPFLEMANDIAQSGNSTVDLKKLTEEMELAILERRSHGGLVHATARGRPQAYMKWIVMKYAEILIAAGDVHFRKGTLESLPLATQRYVEAAHVLGPEPPKVPQLGNRKASPKTFKQLMDDEEEFDKKLNDQPGINKGDSSFILDLPFSAELEHVAKGDLSQAETDFRKEKIVCFLRTPYFCVPLNPKFRQMRSLVHERLFNVRNSRDIQGRVISYALREPPIDPGAFMSLAKQNVNASDALAMVMGDLDSPLPRQRLDVLLSQAFQLCSELRALGERFVSAVEKKEGETFAIMRAQHTTAIQNMMIQMKQKHLEEAEQTVRSLMLTRENQEAQLSFFLQLIGESKSRIPSDQEPWGDVEQTIEEPTHDDLKMSSYEKMEMDMATAASLLNVVATGIDGLVAPFCMFPQIQSYAAPLGVGVSVSTGGSSISSMMQAGSAAIKMAAMLVSDEGSRAGRKAQLTRQLQERRLQANIRGREIKSIDKQIEIQKIRVAAALQDIEIQKSEAQESSQVELWYRTKYTNEQLYGWMEKSVRSLYFQAYTLAMASARRVESALSFQQGRKVSFLNPGGYWDSSHDGLHAADHLQLDLRRLEAMHMEERTYDFEISKTFSLRQIDPKALLRLRVTGSTTISLREALYDMDFPGHYMRRIRSLSISIPAVVAPYSGVNATLTLLQHKYRVSSSASNAAEYDPSTPENEESFRTDRIPTKSIAVSSGLQDAGVFELNFNGPRYMPFEGAGAISDWHLELPTEIKRFDYDTISDVLLHVQYTALDGGPCLRAAANQSIQNMTRSTQVEGRDTGFWAMWDLKNDFANEWHDFTSNLKDGSESQIKPGVPLDTTPVASTASMKLGNLKDRLPFFARSQAHLEVRSISLFSKSNQLVGSMTLNSPVNKDITWDSKPLGDGVLRTCSNLQVRDLDGWVLSAPGGVYENKAVYLVMHYLFR